MKKGEACVIVDGRVRAGGFKVHKVEDVGGVFVKFACGQKVFKETVSMDVPEEWYRCWRCWKSED